LGLEVQETAAGWRVDHRPGRHDDHVIAVGLGVQGIAHAFQINPENVALMGVEKSEWPPWELERPWVDDW
jgi:hypothetical protein